MWAKHHHLFAVTELYSFCRHCISVDSSAAFSWSQISFTIVGASDLPHVNPLLWMVRCSETEVGRLLVFLWRLNKDMFKPANLHTNAHRQEEIKQTNAFRNVLWRQKIPDVCLRSFRNRVTSLRSNVCLSLQYLYRHLPNKSSINLVLVHDTFLFSVSLFPVFWLPPSDALPPPLLASCPSPPLSPTSPLSHTLIMCVNAESCSCWERTVIPLLCSDGAFQVSTGRHWND